jgi:hypothetical protein
MLDRLLHALLAVAAALFAIVLAVLTWIEGGLTAVMNQAHIPPDLQSVVLILVAVLVLLAALRLFGGFIRIVLIVLILVFVVHAVSNHSFTPHPTHATHT